MEPKNDPLVKYQRFPSHLAKDSEKSTEDFGLRTGKAIEYEWFKRKGNSSRFYDQWTEFHRLRLYARGEQSIRKYKDEMKVEGDLSMLNLDWTPVPIIPKFVDIVVNGMSDRDFAVKAYAQDAMSSESRSSYQEMLEADMIAKDVLMDTRDAFGVDAFNVDPEMLPSNDEELSLHMQLNYKPAIEIAEEEAISTVFDFNNYPDIKRRVDYDMTVLGLGIAKHTFNFDGGVVLEYVDPAEVIHSYTEDPNFEDVFYWGEVKQIPITELKKIKPDISDEELEDIKKTNSVWNNEYAIMRPYNDDNLMQEDIVNVMFFNYKTDKTFVWKKKFLDNGGERVIERDEDFMPPEGDDAMFVRVEKKIDVWYEGAMVLGTDHLLKWDMCKNMVRPEAAFQKVYSNYVACAPRLYKGNYESLVRRMIKYADLIQMTHLKLQQVQSRVVPDGVFIDVDGLNDIDLGDGAAYNPQEALKLYFQTGSVLGRSYTSDGEFNHAKVPIQEINHNSGHNKMQALIGMYNHYLNGIRDVTGLNEARDGSTPDPDALVGVQKLAALNSNTATRHILDAGMFITSRLAECVSLRVADILEYSDFKEEFSMQIGKYKVALLEEISKLHLHSFGIFLEVAPDEEEKALLEANITKSIDRDQITIEDSIDIREIKNIKLANQLLKLKRKNKEDKDFEREQQKMQMQGEINAQSAQAAAQSKMQAIDAEKQAKIEIEQAKSAYEIQLETARANLKKELMAEEFRYQMQLKGAESQNLKDRETYKEDRKDKRTDKQASQQSKMIDQRHNGKPPVNFESSEDNLQATDFSQFGPK
jgi:hypothetical protein